MTDYEIITFEELAYVIDQAKQGKPVTVYHHNATYSQPGQYDAIEVRLHDLHPTLAARNVTELEYWHRHGRLFKEKGKVLNATVEPDISPRQISMF